MLAVVEYQEDLCRLKCVGQGLFERSIADQLDMQRGRDAIRTSEGSLIGANSTR
jgi:hypothetical protein